MHSGAPLGKLSHSKQRPSVAASPDVSSLTITPSSGIGHGGSISTQGHGRGAAHHGGSASTPGRSHSITSPSPKHATDGHGLFSPTSAPSSSHPMPQPSSLVNHGAGSTHDQRRLSTSDPSVAMISRAEHEAALEALRKEYEDKLNEAQRSHDEAMKRQDSIHALQKRDYERQVGEKVQAEVESRVAALRKTIQEEERLPRERAERDRRKLQDLLDAATAECRDHEGSLSSLRGQLFSETQRASTLEIIGMRKINDGVSLRKARALIIRLICGMFMLRVRVRRSIETSLLPQVRRDVQTVCNHFASVSVSREHCDISGAEIDDMRTWLEETDLSRFEGDLVLKRQTAIRRAGHVGGSSGNTARMGLSGETGNAQISVASLSSPPMNYYKLDSGRQTDAMGQMVGSGGSSSTSNKHGDVVLHPVHQSQLGVGPRVGLFAGDVSFFLARLESGLSMVGEGLNKLTEDSQRMYRVSQDLLTRSALKMANSSEGRIELSAAGQGPHRRGYSKVGGNKGPGNGTNGQVGAEGDGGQEALGQERYEAREVSGGQAELIGGDGGGGEGNQDAYGAGVDVVPDREGGDGDWGGEMPVQVGGGAREGEGRELKRYLVQTRQDGRIEGSGVRTGNTHHGGSHRPQQRPATAHYTTARPREENKSDLERDRDKEVTASIASVPRGGIVVMPHQLRMLVVPPNLATNASHHQTAPISRPNVTTVPTKQGTHVPRYAASLNRPVKSATSTNGTTGQDPRTRSGPVQARVSPYLQHLY